MKTSKFEFLGHKIELVSYDYGSFLYPCFNGNAEFECNHKGFRQLSSYIRTNIWMNKLIHELE